MILDEIAAQVEKEAIKNHAKVLIYYRQKLKIKCCMASKLKRLIIAYVKRIDWLQETADYRDVILSYYERLDQIVEYNSKVKILLHRRELIEPCRLCFGCQNNETQLIWQEFIRKNRTILATISTDFSN